VLPTFIIALREGLEASLIVGIIAAFLRKEGRPDALRAMWAGVAVALVLCAGVAVALRVIDEQLPQRGQEGLEAVVALVAVAMITWMIVWMRANAAGLSRRLRADAASALARGSAWALVAMAFAAVLREGIETAVFLLAAFQDAADPAPAGIGAVLGVVAAVGLGFGIYRGGVRLDLGRFFRVTGAVLVLVAAGLVSSALHSAAEAGWIAAGQRQALDLSGLLAPGTVPSALVTGVVGVQSRPTQIEVVGWLLYAVPMLLFVLAPDRVRAEVRAAGAGFAVVAVPVVLVAGIAGTGGRPAAGGGGDARGDPGRSVAVAVSAAGCTPAHLRLTSGPATFVVTSHGGARVTEYEVMRAGRIVGEAENLAAGVSGRFSLTLQPGRYALRCPGGATSAEGTLDVTGARRRAALDAGLRHGLDSYRGYLERETATLVDRTGAFVAALRARDLARARREFAWAREPYERVEPVAESFGSLDPSIDARVNDVPRGRWTGFHRIERALWVDGTTRGTRALGDRLLADVRRLQRLTRTVRLEPAQVGSGAGALLGEVSKSKVTGEEDRYSHTDLVDFAANVAGARAAFAAIRPPLARRDPALRDQIDRRFGVVDRALARHRRGDGYVAYTALGRPAVRELAQDIDALAEPISRAPARALEP